MKAKFEGQEVKVTLDYEDKKNNKEEFDNDDNEEVDEQNYRRKRINKSRKKKNKRSSVASDIELRIQFCRTWSHKGYFEQVKKHFEENYSNISVIPENYPLPTLRRILGGCVFALQFGILGLVFGGGYVKKYLGGYIPEKYIDWIGENKIKSGIIAYFGGNLLNGYITNTGAFEIFCNDQLIWSAVNYGGKVPQIQGIIQLIQKAGYQLN